ncbi:MAG: DUF3021 domain-containing protein [Clostridia bacterium]|nr:DUF3021 domain-containing protein [Clostridia bacterium]
MNQYVKNYLQRGIAFGGFGPIVAGLVFWILQLAGVEVVLSGAQVLIAIVSTYILAFVQAGSSVFNQIEEWPLAKSMGLHFLSLYIVYVGCYLVNRWLPFAWQVIAIFTGVFIVVYLAVWLTVYLVVKSVSKKLNKKYAEL